MRSFVGVTAIPIVVLMGALRFDDCVGFLDAPRRFSDVLSHGRRPRTFGMVDVGVGGASSLCATSSDDDDAPPGGDDGTDDLMAEFFKTVADRGIESVSVDEDEDADDSDADSDDSDSDSDADADDESSLRDIPTSEVNRFLGRDDGAVGRLAGNVTFTDRELYGTLKERALESPAAFRRMVGGTDEDDDESSALDDPFSYSPVSAVPDAGLTAGEVVTTVLRALNHNDEPEPDHGLRVLRGYASPLHVLNNKDKALTLDEYADFLKTTEYAILLDHKPDDVQVEKADYAFDRKKSFFTMRLRPPDSVSYRDAVLVNFILSTKGSDEDDCWLIDSIIVRSDARGIRRRRRGRR